MAERKEIEDYLFNHNEEKTEKKMYVEGKVVENKWAYIFKRIKETSLSKFVKK